MGGREREIKIKIEDSCGSEAEKGEEREKTIPVVTPKSLLQLIR